MISKVLFLVLFSAAHAQALPAIFPRLSELVEYDSGVPNNPVTETSERSSRDQPIVNGRTDVETGNGNANVNGDREVSTLRSRPEINKKVTTNRVATNDEANTTRVDDGALSTVLDKFATSEATAEHRIRNSGVGKFADALGQAIGDVVNEKVHTIETGVGSVLEVGRSALRAKGGIVDSKIKLVLSVPRIGERFFAALEKI